MYQAILSSLSAVGEEEEKWQLKLAFDNLFFIELRLSIDPESIEVFKQYLVTKINKVIDSKEIEEVS